MLMIAYWLQWVSKSN